MTVLVIFGIVIIVASLVFNFWWAAKEKSNAKGISSACWAAIIVGFLFVVADRITEIPTPWGSFKAIARQAAIDAHEITKIRKEVETQKKTIDAVAEESERAERLSQGAINKTKIADGKIVTLDSQIQEGHKVLAQIEQDVEFMTTFNAAQSDDRQAYDQLSNWAVDNTYPLQKRAIKAHNEIYEKHASPMYQSGFKFPWKEGVDPSKFTLNELVSNYHGMPDHFKPALIEYTWMREDFSKKDRMQFLIDVMTHDPSIKAVEYAGRYFNSAASLNYKPLTVDKFLEWWVKNKDTV